MKNRPGSNNIVTEWEDNILFDPDDPDFCNQTQNPPSVVVNAGGLQLPPFTFRVSTNMSIASVHQPQINDMYSPLGRSSISMSSSLSDLVGSPLEISMDNVLTIEELRAHMGSCFTCGVSWTDDHVSLDCGECGGYSVERPCPLCDGQCGVQWKRDFTMSHACSKARWQGVCPSYPEALLSAPTIVPSVTAASCAASNQLRLAQELCARLEQLSASAHT